MKVSNVHKEKPFMKKKKQNKIKKFKHSTSEKETVSTKTNFEKEGNGVEVSNTESNWNSVSKKVIENQVIKDKRKKKKKLGDNGENGNYLVSEPTPMEGIEKSKKKKRKKLIDETGPFVEVLEADSHTLEETPLKKKRKKLSMYPPLQSQTERLNEALDTVPPKKKKKLCPANENYKPGMLSNMLQTKKYGQLILPWDHKFGLDPTYKPPETSEETPKLKINPLFDLSKRQKTTSEPTGKTETTIFVGNLPSKTTASQLKSLFKCCGSVRQIKIKRNKPSFIKGNHPGNKTLSPHENTFAFMTLDSAKATKAALELNGGLFRGQHIRVTLKREDGQASKDTSVFLGNVSFAAQDDHLWKMFEKCGEIESVRTIRDSRNGKGKGFGYVNFKSVDSVEAALQLNGSKLLDRELRVSRHDSKARSLSDTATVSKHKLKNKKRKAQNVSRTRSSASSTDGGSENPAVSEKEVKQELKEEQDSANTKVKRKKKKLKSQELE